MAAQSLGTLVVNLAANTAQLVTDLGKAARLTEQQMDKLQKSAAAAGAAIGGALAAGFGIVEESVRRSLDTFDEYSKASQKVGITTEEFSKLAYAAKLSDVSTEDLTTTLAKLSKNQVEAAKGTAAQEQAFQSLGIAVKNADGSLRSPAAVLGDLADIFQALPDGAGKTAIAIQLLGKSGANAIPLLNGGSAALKEMGDEAQRLGVVIDTETGKAAEEFNDNLTRIGVAAQGLGAQLTADLLPDLLALEQRFVALGSQVDNVKLIAQAVRYIGDSAGIAVTGIKALTNGIITSFNATKLAADATVLGLRNSVAGDGYLATIKKDLSDVKDAAAGISENRAELKKQLDEFGVPAGKTADGIAALFEDSIPKAVEATKVSTDDATKKLNAFLDAQKNAAAASKAQSVADAAARKAQAEQEALQKRIAAGQVDMAKSIAEATAQLNQTGIPALDAYNASLLKINEQAEKFTRDGLPADQVAAFTAQMDKLAKATEDAAFAQEQLASHQETLDLAAQAADARSATNGIMGLAVANRDYEKSLEALDKQLNSNAISPEDYKSQLDSLDTLHQQTIAGLKKTADDSGEFVKQAARGVQDALVSALDGEEIKGGFKGFLGGLVDMLRKASAEILAADLAKKLFGDYDKSGQLGGWLGALLGGSGNGGGYGTASASEVSSIQAAEAAITGGGTSGGSGGTSWLSTLFSFFGGGRASGGPVFASQGYLVGEHGPEFFAPTTSGTIVPAGRTRAMFGAPGGNPSVTNIFVQPTTTRRTADQIATANARRQRIAQNRSA